MERSRLIYNGVDLDRFSPDPRNEQRQAVPRAAVRDDELLVLFVAQASP